MRPVGLLICLAVCCWTKPGVEDGSGGVTSLDAADPPGTNVGAGGPTPAETKKAEEEYRIKPNKGKIVSDDARGQLRQPTEKESKAAIKHANAYNKRNKEVLDKMAKGVPVNQETSPENEEVTAQWNSADSPNTKTGRERHALRQVQDKKLQTGFWQKKAEERKQKRKIGYAPESAGIATNPRSEPVILKELTGRDRQEILTPVTHLPSWTGCISGPTYVEYFHHDLKARLTDKEKTWRTGDECSGNCSAMKRECLGYIRHDKGARIQHISVGRSTIHHDCWLIPAAKFPAGGVNYRTMLTGWDHGSVFLKDMSTVDHYRNCTGYKERANVLPKSDFGPPKRAMFKPSAGELAEIKKKSKVFYMSEVGAMNNHPDIDLVDRSRVVSMAYRRQQAQVYVQERLKKVAKKKEAALMVKQERQKKKGIVDALTERTAKERQAKAIELARERGEKQTAKTQKAVALAKERAFKKTPAGIAQDAVLLERKKAAAEIQEKKYKEGAQKNDVWVEKAHKKERLRIKYVNGNITIAYNASAAGNATEKQMRFLDAQGIAPGRRLGESDDMEDSGLPSGADATVAELSDDELSRDM